MAAAMMASLSSPKWNLLSRAVPPRRVGIALLVYSLNSVTGLMPIVFENAWSGIMAA